METSIQASNSTVAPSRALASMLKSRGKFKLLAAPIAALAA
jgi:hypothetical protein